MPSTSTLSTASWASTSSPLRSSAGMPSFVVGVAAATAPLTAVVAFERRAAGEGVLAEMALAMETRAAMLSRRSERKEGGAVRAASIEVLVEQEGYGDESMSGCR